MFCEVDLWNNNYIINVYYLYIYVHITRIIIFLNKD